MKPLKIVLVVPDVPDVGHSGDGITAQGLIESLSVMGGVSLEILALSSAKIRHSYPLPKLDKEINLEILEIPPATKLMRIVKKFLNNFSKRLGLGSFLLPLTFRRHVERFVNLSGPDVVIGYHWGVAFATNRLNLPRVILVGDPLGEAVRLREQQRTIANPTKSRIRGFWRRLRGLRMTVRTAIQRSLMRWALQSAHVFAFSPWHASQYSFVLKRTIPYLRTPYPRESVAPPESRSKKRKPVRVVLLGQLAGSATREGLDFFEGQVFPHLMGALSRGDIEIRVVGGPLEALGDGRWSQMRDNGVKFVGHVFPVLSELLLASAVVVPTSVPLGNRVRILTCWDLGIPVVVHQANQAGIPELLNGYNALVSRSGKEMAEQILHLIGSAELSDELRAGGEWTLQRNFSVETIANDLKSILRAFQS